jgi:ribosomal protein L11 methyltransferase
MSGASFAALDLRWRSGPGAPNSDDTCELIHAQLDEFAPQAILDESADGWRVFFRSARHRDDAVAALRETLGDRLLTIAAVDVPDEEWARRSQANLTAIRVGHIVVAPPWHDPTSSPPDLQPADGDIAIVIDPSTGFGTGHHETTRLCLSLLQRIELRGRRVIDAGTGSGVLAIAAAKLGAAAVVAFDEDPEALRNARENVARNAVTGLVEVREAILSSFQIDPAGVVVANLTGAVIQKHASRLTELVEPGGTLIVSGFNPAEADDVARALALTVERKLTEGDWAAGLFRSGAG